MRSQVLFFLFTLLTLPAARVRADRQLSALTAVLYNKSLPESADLAKFYAKQRGIPGDHLVGLNCSADEEISREDYDTTIADPLREIFKAKGWWGLRETPEHTQAVLTTSIRFVAIMKGVPLKIRATTAPYPGDEPGTGLIFSRNEASVDSELATLGFFT